MAKRRKVTHGTYAHNLDDPTFRKKFKALQEKRIKLEVAGKEHTKEYSLATSKFEDMRASARQYMERMGQSALNPGPKRQKRGR